MPDTPTPRLGLHRPVGGDDADVPFDLGELTDQLDALVPFDSGARASRGAATPDGKIYRSTDGGVDIATGSAWLTVTPPVVTSLPGSPDDGMVIDLVVDSAGTYGGPYLWRCRYRAATDGAYKWHVLGAPALREDNLGEGSISSANGYSSSLTTNNLAGIVLPHGGVYDIVASCGRVSNPAEALTGFGPVLSSEALGTPSHMAWTTLGASEPLSWERRIAAAAGTVRAAYYTSAGTALFRTRFIAVRPVRLG